MTGFGLNDSEIIEKYMRHKHKRGESSELRLLEASQSLGEDSFLHFSSLRKGGTLEDDLKRSVYGSNLVGSAHDRKPRLD